VAFHVCEVVQGSRLATLKHGDVVWKRRQRLRHRQRADNLGQGRDREDVDVGDDGGLTAVCRREE
jgi:hypothetical protein